MHLTRDDLIRLIELVYRAIDEPDGWALAMDEVMHVARLQAAAVAYRAGVDAPFQAVQIYGIDDRYLAEFNERIAFVNPFHQPAEEQGLGYSIEAGASLMPRDEFLRTEYFDWMSRLGTNDILLGLDKMADGSMVSFAGLSPTGELIDDEQIDLLRVIMPHIFKAMALSRQFERLQAERELSRQALAHADFGCVFLGPLARVEWMNDHARQMFERDDALELVGDELRARHPASREALQRAIRIALRLGAEAEVEPPSPRVKIERQGPGRPVEVLISPMRPLARRLFGPSGGALILLADPEHVDERFAERLEALYGLTPTEAEVAQWLLVGVSTARIAEIFGNSVHTIRSHIKSLLQKCGASSRAELVGVLQRSLARLG